MVAFFNSNPDIGSREHGEDKGLQEGNQEFEGHHEERERNGGGNAGSRTARAFARLTQNEDKADEAQDHNVPCGDIGKKTKEEGKGLQEEAQNLYRRQNQDFQNGWYARHPQGMRPKMLVGAECGDQEGQKSQNKGNGDITGYVGAAWEEGNLTDQVQAEDEKESGHEVTHVLFIFRTNIWLGYFVANERVEWLKEILQTPGGFAAVALGRTRYATQQEKQNEHREQHGKYVAGDAEIHEVGDTAAEDTGIISSFSFKIQALTINEGSINRFGFAGAAVYTVCVVCNLVGLAAVGWVENTHYTAVNEHITVVRLLSIAMVMRVEGSGGTESPTLIVGIKDNRQVYIKIADDMNGIGVGNVMHGVVARIKFCFSIDGMTAGAVVLTFAVAGVGVIGVLLMGFLRCLLACRRGGGLVVLTGAVIVSFVLSKSEGA